MRARPIAFVLFLLWMLLGVEGCFLHGGAADDIGADDPGAKAWKAELACNADSDCQAGEACTDGICQPKRCGDASAYRSAPPLGQSSTFLFARDLIAAATTSVEGYSPRDGTFARVGSGVVPMGGTLQDVAGGNLFGTKPEAFAMASAGSSTVKIRQGEKSTDLAVGFAPIALAAGDTDGDGVDELLAAAADGTFAICTAGDGKCARHSLGASGVIDVAMGDIDADGSAEPLFLLGDRILVFNLDAEATKQEKIISQAAGRTLTRIATGDLDGDGVDEIVGTEKGGYFGSDKVHVYAFKNAKLTLRASKDVDGTIRDVSVVQAGEQKGRVAVLRTENIVEMDALSTGDQDTLATDFQSKVGSSADVLKIASADVDGDSPSGRLKGEAKLVAGPTAPIAVLGIPPYSQRYSAGPARASLGSNESKDESVSTTVSLSLQVTVSADFDLFGLLKAGVNARLGGTQSQGNGFSKSKSVGQAFFIAGDPTQNGYDAGGVVLGCGCFLQFDYEIDDPKNSLGGNVNGKTMSVLVPVGGQTTLWSTRRYNALASALGTLPKIKMPYKLGDIASYPTEALTLGGKPVPGDDMLFPNPPSFRVSDLATVMFSLSEASSKSNSNATTISYGGGVKAGAGVSVAVDVTKAITQSYEVRVSRSTTFSGFVEPLKNNLQTPEDEFANNAYSFTPYVYREHYKLGDEEAGLFVLLYSVGK